MTIKRNVGEEIGPAPKIAYFAGKSPTIERAGGKMTGKLARNGYAYVDGPLTVVRDGRPPDAGDCIIFHTAKYECDQVKEAHAKKSRGAHRDFFGFLKGNATASIVMAKRQG